MLSVLNLLNLVWHSRNSLNSQFITKDISSAKADLISLSKIRLS